MANEEREKQQSLQYMQNILLRYMMEGDGPSVEALKQSISALEREGQMEAQPSPDLEPVRELVDAITRYDEWFKLNECSKDLSYWNGIANHARLALPTLKSLLVENERLTKLAYIGEHHFEDNTYKARLDELVPQYRDLQAEVKGLRGELAAATLTEHLTNFHELKRLQEDRMNLIAMAALIQQNIQPVGSPPPGGIVSLCQWAISETVAELKRLREENARMKELNAQTASSIGRMYDEDAARRADSATLKRCFSSPDSPLHNPDGEETRDV